MPVEGGGECTAWDQSHRPSNINAQSTMSERRRKITKWHAAGKTWKREDSREGPKFLHSTWILWVFSIKPSHGFFFFRRLFTNEEKNREKNRRGATHEKATRSLAQSNVIVVSKRKKIRKQVWSFTGSEWQRHVQKETRINIRRIVLTKRWKVKPWAGSAACRRSSRNSTGPRPTQPSCRTDCRDRAAAAAGRRPPGRRRRWAVAAQRCTAAAARTRAAPAPNAGPAGPASEFQDRADAVAVVVAVVVAVAAADAVADAEVAVVAVVAVVAAVAVVEAAGDAADAAGAGGGVCCWWAAVGRAAALGGQRWRGADAARSQPRPPRCHIGCPSRFGPAIVATRPRHLRVPSRTQLAWDFTSLGQGLPGFIMFLCFFSKRLAKKSDQCFAWRFKKELFIGEQIWSWFWYDW